MRAGAVIWMLSVGSCVAATPQVGAEAPRAATESNAQRVRAEAIEEQLVRHIAEERRTRKLPALSRHDGLARVAEAHSRDMKQHRYVAHRSPRTGGPEDRVSKAGIRTKVLLENVGRGYGASEIHAALMESPGHRKNILNPKVRSVGVGVVAEPEAGQLAYYVTELFADVAADVRLSTAAADLFDAIRTARKARGLGAVVRDPALSRVAQQVADAAAKRPDRGQAALESAVRSVVTLPKGADVLTGALVKAVDLEQAAETERLLDRSISALGIGVSRLPRDASHPIVVVFLLALRQ